MINRELIRLKIVQLVYAYYQNGDKSIETAEKELGFSLSKSYDMYQYLLLLMVEVTKVGKLKLETQISRNTRVGNTEDVNRRFVNNRFIAQLAENKQLLDFQEKQKKTWNEEDAYIKRLYKLIIDSTIYGKYMVSEEDSYAADREFWRQIYKKFITNNEELDALLEEQSLYWNDDKEVIDSFVIKTIKRFDESNGADQALLPEYDNEEDREFSTKLFTATLKGADEYRELIKQGTKNWDISRMPLMDLIIAQIALAEITQFPSIPLNVSFNEYLDIAKVYSTPRSPSYLNGLLDHIVKKLIDEKKLIK